MPDIPENAVGYKDVIAWYTKKGELAKLKAEEMLLRMRVFKNYFTKPREGANNHTLEDGYVLAATQPIERKVDAAQFDALKKVTVGAMRPQLTAWGFDTTAWADDKPVAEAMSLNVDKLVEWEPKLAMKEYRALTAEQVQFFDQCLTIKPGSPSMDVKPPSTRRRVGDTAESAAPDVSDLNIPRFGAPAAGQVY